VDIINDNNNNDDNKNQLHKKEQEQNSETKCLILPRNNWGEEDFAVLFLLLSMASI